MLCWAGPSVRGWVGSELVRAKSEIGTASIHPIRCPAARVTITQKCRKGFDGTKWFKLVGLGLFFCGVHIWTDQTKNTVGVREGCNKWQYKMKTYM